MKLLLTMNLPHTRAHGGTNRSNRCLTESLAARGHHVQVVSPALASPSPITYQAFLEQREAEGIAVQETGGGVCFKLNGVEVHSVREATELRAYLQQQIKAFVPDWVMVSSEDPTQNLLSAALSVCPDRVVYLAHTPQMLPFGPASLYASKKRTAIVQQVTAVVAISHFVANYIKKWAGLDVFVNHPPHFGTGPFPHFHNFNKGHVLLMNASDIKGFPIFFALAQALPDIPFAALPGYATTSRERQMIDQLPNATMWPNRAHLDDILRVTRLLLMPSLWIEGFGMAAVDVMLRGIPVIASHYGGLIEGKIGTDYSLPVQPITTFREQLDENLLPIPIVPKQDIRPWCEALTAFLTDQTLYETQSSKMRERALAFISQLDVAPLENFLQNLPYKQTETAVLPTSPTVKSGQNSSIANLTSSQRALLTQRLLQQRRKG